MKSRKALVPVVLALTLLVTACNELNTPQKATGNPKLVVFGDSIAPDKEYVEQAKASGYTITNNSRAATSICTGASGTSSGDRYWKDILQAIDSKQYDAMLLHYNAHPNYDNVDDCGGFRTDSKYRSSDPGRRWRIFLETVAYHVAINGNKTHVFLAGSPGGLEGGVPGTGNPARGSSFFTSMNVLDTAGQVMADRFPSHLSFVPVRFAFGTENNAYTYYMDCLPQEKAANKCGKQLNSSWPNGKNRLRTVDSVHLECVGEQVYTSCNGFSPGGLRYSYIMFNAMNKWFEANPV